MAEDIVFSIDGDASGAVAAIGEIINALTELNALFDTLTANFAIFDELGTAAQTAADGVTTLDDAGTAAEATLTAISDVATQADAAMTTLADSVTTAGDSLIQFAQEDTTVADTLAVIDDAATVATQAFMSFGEAFGMSDNLIAMTNQDISMVADEFERFGGAVTVAGEGVYAFDGEASAMMADLNGMLEALDATDAALTNQSQAIMMDADAYAGVTPAMEAYIQACNDLVNSSISVDDALTEMVTSATEMGISLADAQPVIDGVVEALTTLTTATADESTSMASAVQYVDAFQQSFNNITQTVATATEALTTNAEAITTSADASVQAAASFDLVTQAAIAVDTAFSAMGMSGVDAGDAILVAADAAQGLWDNLTNLASAAADAMANILGLNAAMDEDAAAATADGDAKASAGEAAQGAGFMMLMLAQAVIQATGSFIQSGIATQSAIAQIVGLANPSLQAASAQGTLSQMIQQVSADSIKYGIDMTTASQALYFIQSQGYSTGDSLNVLNSVMEFAATTGTKVDVVSRALTSAMNAYGVSANQAGQYTDIMTAAITQGSMTGTEYAAVIGKLAAQGHQAGFSFQEVNAALAVMSRINPSVAQDSMNLNNMFIQLGDNADKIDAAAKKLNISFDETKFKSMDLGDKLKYIAQISGGDTTPAFEKLMLTMTSARAGFFLLENAGTAYDDTLQKMGQSQGRLDQAFSVFSATVAAGSARISATLSVLSYQFVTLISPLVTPMLNAVADALGFVATHVEILAPLMAGLAVIVGGILVMAFSALWAMVGAATVAMLAVAAPLALIAAGAVAAGMGIAALAQHFPALGFALSGAAQLVSKIANYLEAQLAPAFHQAGQAAQQFGAWFQASAIPAIAKGLTDFILFADGLLGRVVPALDDLQNTCNPLMTTLNTLGQWVRTLGQAFVQLGPGVQAAWQLLQQLGGIIMTSIQPALNQLWSTVETQLVPAWMHLMTALTPLMPALGQIAAFIGGVLLFAIVGIIGALTGLLTFIVGFISGVVQAIGGVAQFISGVLQVVAGLVSAFIALCTGNLQQYEAANRTVTQGIQDIWTGLGNFLMGFWNATGGAIIQAIGAFCNVIITFFQNLANTLVGHSIWPDMLTAMMTTFTSFVSNIISAVTSFIAQIIALFTTFAAQALAIFQQAWQGIQTACSTALAAISALLSGDFAQFVALITQAGQQMLSAMQRAWQGMLSAAQSGIAGIIGAVNGFVSTLAGIFANLAGAAVTWGVHFMQGLASGIMSGMGAAVAAATNVAGAVAKILGHTTPSEGPMAGDDMWMHHFGDNLTEGLNAQVGKVKGAALNVATSITTATPTASSFASSTTSASNSDVVTVLQAILAELQSHGKNGANGALGHSLPSTNIATAQTTNNFNGGSGSMGAIYQGFNKISGIANEYGVRGSSTGIAT